MILMLLSSQQKLSSTVSSQPSQATPTENQVSASGEPTVVSRSLTRDPKTCNTGEVYQTVEPWSVANRMLSSITISSNVATIYLNRTAQVSLEPGDQIYVAGSGTPALNSLNEPYTMSTANTFSVRGVPNGTHNENSLLIAVPHAGMLRRCGPSDTWRDAEIETPLQFGAKGDGIHDDTSAFQAMFAYLSTSSARVPTGKFAICPAGTYRLSETVTIFNVMGLNFQASQACTFTWAGDDDIPMFDLQNLHACVFSGFRIVATTQKPLAEAIRIEHVKAGTLAPSGNVFRDIYCEGTDGGIKYCFRGAVGSFGDANTDFMYFDNVRATNYSVAAWSIEGTQMVNWMFTNCYAVADFYGKFAISGGSSSGAKSNILWYGGFVGNNLGADFYVNTPSGYTTTIIDGVQSEGSSRFFTMDGNTGSRSHTVFRGIRFAANHLKADGQVLQFRGPGPWTIENCAFGESATVNTKLSVLWSYIPGFSPPGLEIRNTVFRSAINSVSQLFPDLEPTQILDSYIESPVDRKVISLDKARTGYYTYATLPKSPSDGDIVVCSDCTVGKPTSSGGTGALLVRVGGIWIGK